MLRSKPLLRTLDTRARLSVPVDECDVCGKGFIKRTTLHTVCSPKCLLKKEREKEKAQSLKAKEERKKDRARKEKLKPISYWEKKAEAAVNKYVRLRDWNDGCISCHLPATWGGQWHASHFRSVGAASAVRYNLWNIHKACSVCNNYKSGNLSEYEPRIRAKIGDEKVDWLRTQNQVTRYSVEYLQRLEKIFNKRCRRKTQELGK